MRFDRNSATDLHVVIREQLRVRSNERVRHVRRPEIPVVQKTGHRHLLDGELGEGEDVGALSRRSREAQADVGLKPR